MPILVNCACGKEYPVKDDFAGKRVKCPACGEVLTVPSSGDESEVDEVEQLDELDELEPADAGAVEAAEVGDAENVDEAVEEAPPPKKKGKGMLFAVLGCGCLLVFLGTGAVAGLGGVGYYLGWFKDLGPDFAYNDDSDTDTDKNKDSVQPAPKDNVIPPPKDNVIPPPPPRKQPRPKPPEEEGPWKGHQSSIIALRFPTFEALNVISVAGGMEKDPADGSIDVALDNSIRYWNIDTGSKVKVLDQFKEGIEVAAISQDGRYAALVYPGKLNGDVWEKGSDNVIHVWDLKDKEPKETGKLPGHTANVLCLTFKANSQHLLSGGADNMVRLWKRTPNGWVQENMFPGHTAAVTGVAFSPGGSEGASCSADGSVRLWKLDADAGANAFIRDFKGHNEAIRAIAFSDDGTKLFTGGGDADPSIRVWNVADGMEIRQLKGHTKKVTALAIAPDGRRALSGSADNSVRLWHVNTGVELARYDGSTAAVNAVALFPDGKRALSGGDDKKLRVWNLPPDVKEIMAKLTDADLNVRLQAVKDLARFGDEALPAVPALMKCLNATGNVALRTEVVALLKKLNAKVGVEDIQLLITLVGDKMFPEGRLFALDALAPLGAAAKPAMPALLIILKENDTPAKCKAIEILGQIGPEVRNDVYTQFIDFLRSPDADLVKAATEALPKLGKPEKEQMAALGRFLTDSNVNVRRYALTAVTDLGPAAESMQPQLIEVVKSDVQPEMRKLAITALLKVKPKDAATVDVLAGVVKKNDDTMVSLHALTALVEIGPGGGALPGLLNGLEQKDKDVQKAAEEAFDKAVFEKAQVKALASALRSRTNPRIRGKIVDALLKLGADAEDAAEELGLVAKESEGDLRLKAIKGLAELGPAGKKAAPELLAMLDSKTDKDDAVRIEAAIALTKIGAVETKQALPHLVKGLLVTNASDTKQYERQERVRKILIQIGQPAADSLAKTLGPSGDFYNAKTTTPAGMQAVDARRKVLEIFKEMGPKAYTGGVPLALASMAKDDPDKKLREMAAEVLKAIQK